MQVNVVSDIKDDKIIAAIRSGNVPDVVSSFASSNVGSYWLEAAGSTSGRYLKQARSTSTIVPAGAEYYTQYKGVRCALPLLADDFGLYYNKTLFKQAGINAPPQTFSELTADARS